jgi:hypothetical protein
VNFGAAAYMSINRPFCGRASRNAAEDVLAVQVYLTTDAMPSISLAPVKRRSALQIIDG